MCVLCVHCVFIVCVCGGGGMVACFGEQDNMMYMHAVFTPEYFVLDGILQTVCKYAVRLENMESAPFHIEKVYIL